MTTKTSIISVGLVLIVLVVAGGFVALRDNPAEPLIADGQLVVAATIFPLADIASHIAGDDVHVLQLLPSGASPHSYTITPQQLAQFSQSSALFVIGHGLDNWAIDVAADVAESRVVTVDGGITLHEFSEAHSHEEHAHDEDEAHDDHDEEEHHDEEEGDEHQDHNHAGGLDPHYWLTVPNAQKIAVTIAETLVELDPANSAHYEQNLADYVSELDALERELQQQANRAPQKHFIAMHDAWSYFSEAYGFELVASYEPVEGQQPSVADIQELQEEVNVHDITAFFSEPQKQSSAATRFLERELGLEIRVLDPVGGIDERESYIDLMRANMAALTQ